MPRITPPGALASILLVAALGSAVGGCTPSTPAASSETSAPATAAAPASATTTEVVVTRMNPDEARAKIAPTFPPEVPVAMGTVVQGKAQGPDAWDYELRVPAPVIPVASWYLAEYQRRAWELTDQQKRDDGSYLLKFRKGTAESEVTVGPSASAGESAVNVVLGVGAPVLETQ